MRIKLVTYQSKRAINKLRKTGELKITKNEEKYTYVGRDNSSNRPFDYGYRYIIYRMNERIKKPDNDITFPIWAWYLMNGKRKPPKEFDKIHKGNYRITFYIDTSEILLSDFDMFCYLLAGGLYFAYTKEEKEYFEKHLFDDEVIYFYPNLDRMLDYNSKQNRNRGYCAPKRKMTIQATFWKLKIEQVLRIEKV